MSSLPNTLLRWYSTVRGLMNSCAKISGLERPSLASNVLNQRRLADPLLAAHHKHRALPGPDTLQFAVQHLALVTSPSQHLAPPDAGRWTWANSGRSPHHLSVWSLPSPPSRVDRGNSRMTRDPTPGSHG